MYLKTSKSKNQLVQVSNARMVVVFCKWIRFDVGIKGGTATTVRRAPAVLCWTWIDNEHGLTMNVKKTKVMVFNFVDSCQEFVFNGDVIERVQTFKYLGTLLETTLNLDRVVDALPNPGVNPFEGSPKCSCGKLGLGRRSRLPAL